MKDPRFNNVNMLKNNRRRIWLIKDALEYDAELDFAAAQGQFYRMVLENTDIDYQDSDVPETLN
jgi:hypothetical protein